MVYLTLPVDKRRGLVTLALTLLPVHLIALGIIIALWRRFPIADEQDKKD